MTPEQMIQRMLDLQDELNKQIHPQWREQHYPWHRAIWMECAELMDHLGWKWWSAKKKPDLDHVRLELVDIWHFMLSDCLQTGTDAAEIKLFWGLPPSHTGKLRVDHVEEIAEYALGQQTPIETFAVACAAVGVTLSDLYALYLGKQTLNRFRQDHGYKEGTYEKMWSGEEDNKHLASIISNSSGVEDFGSEEYQKMIYEELDYRYAFVRRGVGLG